MICKSSFGGTDSDNGDSFDCENSATLQLSNDFPFADSCKDWSWIVVSNAKRVPKRFRKFSDKSKKIPVLGVDG